MNHPRRKGHYRYYEDEENDRLREPRRNDGDDDGEEEQQPKEKKNLSTPSTAVSSNHDDDNLKKKTSASSTRSHGLELAPAIATEVGDSYHDDDDNLKKKTSASSTRSHQLELAPAIATGEEVDDEDIIEAWDEDGPVQIKEGKHHKVQEQEDHRMTFRQSRLLDESSDEEQEDAEDIDGDVDDRPGAIQVGSSRMAAPTLDEEAATITYSMGGSNGRNDTSVRSNGPPNNNEEHLVTAELAPEPPEIVQGIPLAKKKNRRLYVFVFAAGVIGIALFLGLYFSFDNTGNRDDINANENNVIIINVTASPTQSLVPTRQETSAPTQSLVPTQSATAGPTQSATASPTTSPAPTTLPTTAPTQSVVPTAAPTPSPMEIAISILSPYIPDIPNGTVQEQALDWIVGNDTGLIQELAAGGEDEDDQVGRFLDRYVLAVLYLSMNGPEWVENRSWLSEFPVCVWWVNSWVGQGTRSICDDNDRASYIHFAENNLNGTIPTEIGALTTLTELMLFRNSLTGSIPSEIGALTALTELRLDQNALSGPFFPTEFGSLTGLTFLDFFVNRLSGTIPTEIGTLTGLSGVWLQNNNLTGTIPTEIGALTDLAALRFSENALTGNLPTQLGQLTALTSLQLSNNNLTGVIPLKLQGFLANLALHGPYGCSLGCNDGLIEIPDHCLVC